MLMMTQKKGCLKKSFFFFLSLCITALLVSAQCVQAKELQSGKGVSHDNSTHNSQDDIESLKRLAEQGDVESQFLLGNVYREGKGIVINLSEAKSWYEKAAKKGHANAQFGLGLMYFQGEGTRQDYKEALKWWRKSAEQGVRIAQMFLGEMLYHGNGVTQDYREAREWLKMAAEQGDGRAQNFLGEMYSKGLGVEQDYQKSMKWYRMSAESGDALAQHNLGAFYYFGHGVPKDYEEALRWYRSAAENGYIHSQCFLGYMYRDGKGTPQNYVTAYYWLNLAASKLEEAAEDRDDLALLMTPEQIAESQRMSAQSGDNFSERSDTSIYTEPSPVVPNSPKKLLKSTGTAFAVSNSGYFLTSAHVVQEVQCIELYGGGNIYPARVIKVDHANDVALLKVEGTFSVLPLVLSGSVKLGTEVFTIGFPNVGIQGLSPKLTKGEISSLAGVQDDPRYFQISTPVQPGNSGGPLVDMQGKVIGIIAAIMNQEVALETTGTLAQNVNYAVKSSYILPLLEAVPGLSDEVASDGRNNPLSTEEAIARAEKATFLLVTY